MMSSETGLTLFDSEAIRVMRNEEEAEREAEQEEEEREIEQEVRVNIS
jgi:hypothetical protein